MKNSSESPGNTSKDLLRKSFQDISEAEPPVIRWQRLSSLLASRHSRTGISSRDLAVALEWGGYMAGLELELPKGRPVWFVQILEVAQNIEYPSDPALQVDLPLSPGLPRKAFEAILGRKPLEVCVQALIQTQDPAFLDLLGLEIPPKRQDALKNLEGALECKRFVFNRLSKVLLGQSEAIEALAGFAFQLHLEMDGTSRPRTALMMGPPGVGKSLAAQEFGLALQEWEAGTSPLSILEVDLSQYVQWSSSTDLFGDSSKRGLLTGRMQPGSGRTLIICHELEKAHPKVLEAFLPVLGEGFLTCPSGVRADFSRAVFLFTSNLGEEFWGRPSQPENSAFVLDPVDLLSLAEDRSTLSSGWAKSSLPSSLLSRLARGPVLLFRRHHGHHLLEKVLGGCLSGQESALMEPQTYQQAGLNIEIDREVVQALVLTHLVGRDLRSADQFLSRLLQDLLAKAQEQFGSRMRVCANQPLRIVADKGLHAQLAKALQDVKVPIRLVSDNPCVTRRIRKRYSDHSCLLEVVTGRQGLGALPPGALVLVDSHKDKVCPSVPPQRGMDHLVQRVLLDPPGFWGLEEIVRRHAMPFEPLAKPKRNEHPMTLDRLTEALDSARFSRLFESCLGMRQRWKTHLDLEFRKGGITASLRFDGTERFLDARHLRQEIPWAEIPRERFDDLIGLDPLKERLREYLTWLANPGGEPGIRGCVLSGPPGTGKTLACRAAAGEASVPCIAIGGADFLNQYFGQTEAVIRETFRSLQRYDAAILVVDEIDGIAWRRDQSNEWMAATQSAIVGQLLRSLDELASGPGRVLILATTNQYERVDPALVRSRRIRDHFHVGPPGPEERRAFLRKALGATILPEDVDELVGLATGMTPADLTLLIEKARREAGSLGHPVDMVNYRSAALELRRGESDMGVRLGESEKRRVAVHEAGHAVLAYQLLGPGSLEHLTVTPTGSGTLGAVYRRPSEKSEILDLGAVERNLAVLLGGRVAEGLLFPEEGPSSGAGGDLREATNLALHAVSSWGLDPAFPLVSLEALPPSLQHALAPRVFERVQALIDAAETTAKASLERHKPALEQLSKTLFQLETIHRPEAIAILGGFAGDG